MASNVVDPQERIEKVVAVFKDQLPLALTDEYKDHVRWKVAELSKSEGKKFSAPFSLPMQLQKHRLQCI